VQHHLALASALALRRLARSRGLLALSLRRKHQRGSFGKDFPRGLDTVERGWKARERGHLDHDFDQVRFGATGVERAVNVRPELRGGAAHGGECGDRRDLARFQIQAGARVHAAEDKFDGVSREIGRDALDAFKHTIA